MRALPILAAGVAALAGGLLVNSMRADEISARARQIQMSAIVIDTHDDTPQRFLFDNFDLGRRDTEGSIDIPRMRQGNLGGIFFSIWVPIEVQGPAATKRALDLIDTVREQVAQHPNDLTLATTAEGVRAAHAQHKIAALMGVEGGHMIDNDLRVLRDFYALGVRYMTLTHTADTDWAGSSGSTKNAGLTDFGKQVVLEMNRLGMIVDISHVSDKTFYDAVAVSRAPMIASHSSCRAICDAPRNMTDDMIRALAAKGGVIQINYHIGFLSQEYKDARKAIDAEYAPRDKANTEKYANDEAQQIIAGQKLSDEFVRAGKLPKVSYEKIVDHIDHAVKIAGADHVGLGSDFDGAVMPIGMEDASMLPKITESLLRRGYTESDIRKILGENTLRVMAEVERVSRETRNAKN